MTSACFPKAEDITTSERRRSFAQAGGTDFPAPPSMAKPPQRQAPGQFLLPSIVAFYVFLFANCLAAFYAPIQDCDEVFNYWEPTHYLNHGYGLQTWEYSPEYSIRSWLYIVIHAAIGKLGYLLSRTKTFEFYFIRTILALTCALCESRLYSVISRTLNPRIAILFMIISVFSPGMFHASAAYLPSSFAMYTTMLGMSAFMDWRGGSRTAQGIMWFSIGGIVGWPFAVALITPFLLEELVLATLTREGIEVARRFLDGTVRSLLVLALQVAMDTFFYHKVVIVPWRIIWYNVFSGSSKGPDIFGTEPWDFYLRNLLLNFNVWFVLAMAVGPLLCLQYLLGSPTTTKQTMLRSVVFVTPFYLWLAIFTAQPHKEERFMYPAYPFLGLNAALALHIIFTFVGSSNEKALLGKVPGKVKLVFASGFVILAIDTGLLRTFGMITAYRAPLTIYRALEGPGIAIPGETVCYGKEWYRFPSSYFLPNGMRAKFVKSAFDGLLPGEFNEAQVGFGFFAGTWLIPPGMNDQNIADPSKYVEIEHCSYIVDSYFPGSEPSELEPNYTLDTENWEEIQCTEFLDASRTDLVGRTLWLPDSNIVPGRFRRRWARYCLLRRKTAKPRSSELQATPMMDKYQLCVHDYFDSGRISETMREIASHPKPILYGVLIVVLAGWLVIFAFRKFKRPAIQRASTPDLEKPAARTPSKFKAPERQPGEWIPVDFKRPAAPPYPNWDVHTTKPLPYRPFRYGPYYITMGLRSMNWDEWIELDNHYPRYHADKARRIKERGHKCCKTAPEAFDGAVELLEEFCDYLPQRYPSLYRKTAVGMDNLLTGESFNIIERPLAEDPMQMAARMVQDDLAIMFERPDGQYYLLAGAILLAGFWRLEDKFGMPLSEIHTSGDVPGFREKLEKGMMNFFRRVQPDGPVLRNNYFIQVDDELAWSRSIGDEDSKGIGWYTAEKNKAIQHHYFRTERQSLRRLPRSGGVVFTIRTYFHPIMEIAEQPYVPGRLAAAVRSWGDDVGKYKGRERYQDVLLEYLDQKHEKQVANGLEVEKEEEVHHYPY